jgi:integrase
MATALQILKETGCRAGELQKIEWQHIDTQRRTIYIIAEKGSNSRILPISNKLIDMLNQLPHTTAKLFPISKKGMRTTFEGFRKRTATKLGNPRLLKMHLHTLRHWKATTEYHKTRDIIHVKNTLGHRNIESTMIYINLENALFLNESEEFICKIAQTPEEAQKLIELGFTKADEFEGKHLYRKRK